MIRQTATGMEQFCQSCADKGEPNADCWLPLSDEFFPRKYRGATRVTWFEHRCKVCKEERRQMARQMGHGNRQECAA